jgi:hypothetical protein
MNQPQPGQIGYVNPELARHYQLIGQVNRGELPQQQQPNWVAEETKHQSANLYQQHHLYPPNDNHEPEPSLRYGEQDNAVDKRWTRGDKLPQTRYL